MKKVLLLLANGFEIYEASVFIDVIGWNKIEGNKQTELLLCGKTSQVTSTFGVKLDIDILLQDVNINEFDALAIPGGFEEYGFYNDAYSVEFQNIILEFDMQTKPIASICVGALALGKSGILQNRSATTYNLNDGYRQKQLKEFCPNVINKPIVIDEHIITSWSPVTAIDVALALLEKLTNEENKNLIRKLMGFSN